MQPTPSLDRALLAVKELLKMPLPAALPQTCCSGGTFVTVRLSNDEVASFGPCDRPPIIDRVSELLSDAYGQD